MASQFFFKSNNRGDTWRMNTTDLTKNVNRWSPEMPIMGVAGDKPMAEKHDGYSSSSLITQVRESPSRPGIIWIGTDDGNLQLSRDGGETFTERVSATCAGAPRGYVQISRIEPSHFDPGRPMWRSIIIATTIGSRICSRPPITERLGPAWRAICRRRATSTRCARITIIPNLLFVGTEFGLFVTLDGGKEWKKFMTNLPSVRVDDILIHPRDRDLIIATHGRSIWIADDISPLEKLKAPHEADLVLFEPRPAMLWKNRSGRRSGTRPIAISRDKIRRAERRSDLGEGRCGQGEGRVPAKQQSGEHHGGRRQGGHESVPVEHARSGAAGSGGSRSRRE